MLTHDTRYQDPRDELPRSRPTSRGSSRTLRQLDVAKYLIDALTQLAWVVIDIPPPQRPDRYHPDAPGIALAELRHQLDAITPDRVAAKNFNPPGPPAPCRPPPIGTMPSGKGRARRERSKLAAQHRRVGCHDRSAPRRRQPPVRRCRSRRAARPRRRRHADPQPHCWRAQRRGPHARPVPCRGQSGDGRDSHARPTRLRAGR